MVETGEIRMPLTSADLLGERIDALRELFPEVFAEGKIDFDRLRLELGDEVVTGPERYGLTWPGKAEALRAIQTPSTGTLTPMPEESVHFDTSENLIIEGDNLEVLKLLQKSYHGKVKMIYIDPPYNTGKEFIYPDNFREGLRDYLQWSGQIDERGARRSINTEASGRYHSNWLSMMYPRLFLARNLLRPDGVIFISIDDHEDHNLRHLLDGVFGEENYLGTIVWKKKTNGNNMGFIPPVHDYFICYAKQASEESLLGFPLSDEYIAKTYSNPDDDPRGPWTTSDLGANHKGPYFPITNPSTGQKYYPAPGRYWVFNEQEVSRRIQDGRIIFGKTGTSGPVQKKFLSERSSMRRKAESWWDIHGLNEDGTAELAQLVGLKVFEHPKPSKTLEHLCNIATNDDDLILDFFAGSGTIAHSVVNLNHKDGGSRKYILVQLPEPTDHPEYPTIADICRERVRRVIEQQNYTDTECNERGQASFRAFKLTSSNFKVWDADKSLQGAGDLARQLELYADHLLPDRTQLDVLYELILKFGLELTISIEQVEIPGGTAYRAAGDNLLICLENQVTKEMLRAMMDHEPVRVVCLDQAFGGNDQLKTRACLQSQIHSRIQAMVSIAW